MITCTFIGNSTSIRVTGAKSKKAARTAAIEFSVNNGMKSNFTMDDGWLDAWDTIGQPPADWKDGYVFQPVDKHTGFPPGVVDSATCPHTHKHPEHGYCLDCGSI